HLIERITNKSITNKFLENELRDILRQRDDLVSDRFDNIIKRAQIIDVKSHINSKELVRLIIDRVCMIGHKNLQINQREIKASVITPFVAVPHLIVDGEKVFDIIIVRCKKGVYLSREYQSVKAIFFLIGTKDEKTMQLQSISSIAQIIYNKNYEKQWLQAKDITNIKDILLLSMRHRIE
ncbi:PTS sugar transporter subunit IIA, partial [Candidatus Margulisiibacteriota bacterium]